MRNCYVPLCALPAHIPAAIHLSLARGHRSAPSLCVWADGRAGDPIASAPLQEPSVGETRVNSVLSNVSFVGNLTMMYLASDPMVAKDEVSCRRD
jgi:hypothetical protein